MSPAPMKTSAIFSWRSAERISTYLRRSPWRRQRAGVILGVSIAALVTTAISPAATNIFEGGFNVSDGDWDLGTFQWSLGHFPSATDALLFNHSFVPLMWSSWMNADCTVQTLSFNTAGDVFGIDADRFGVSHTLALTGGTNANGGTDTISLSSGDTGSITLGGEAIHGVLTVAFGANTGTINVANAAGTLTFGSSSIVTGTNGITVRGSGTVAMLGANTYSGVTTISGGTLLVNSLPNEGGSGGTASSIGVSSNAAGNLVLNGGTLAYVADAGNVTTDRGFTVNSTNGGGITVGSGTSLTFTGQGLSNISAPASLTVNGPGTLTLAGTGDNSFLNLIVNTGTIVLAKSSAGNVHAAAGVTINGGTVQLGGTGGDQISDAGNLVVAGGTFTMGAFNETVNAVQLTGGSITGTGVLTMLSPSGMQAGSISASLAGSVGLTKSGAGTVTLSGTNTYTGGTAINGGLLNLGSSGALGTTGTISFGGGTLQYTAANLFDYSARFSTANSQAYSVDTNGQNVTWTANLTSSGGSLTKLGTGTLALVGTNTYTGGTAINGGVLNLGSISALGTTGVISFGGGTLQYSSANNIDYSARFSTSAGQAYRVDTNGENRAWAGNLSSSGGSLTKLGAGLLQLSGVNTYSGSTTISGGTLQFTKAASLYNSTSGSLSGNVDASHLIVQSGATAAFNVGGTGEFSLAEFVTLAGLGTASGGFQSGSFIGIDTTNAGVGGVTISNNLTNTNGGANALGFTKLGVNTLTFTGANTFSGGVNINGGAVKFDTGGGLVGGGPINVNAGCTLTITSAAGVMDIGNNALTVDGTNASPAAATMAKDFAAAAETIGSNGSATMTHTAGINNVVNTVLLGDKAGSNGTYNLSGSAVVGGDYLVIGKNGSGTYNQNGGITVFNFGISLAVGAGSSATLNLNGGTMYTGGNVMGGSGTSVFNFNGGTLLIYPYYETDTTLMSGITATNVQAGGAIINTQIFNAVISQNLVHDPTIGAPPLDGGLTVSGTTGLLELTGSNTYTGGTRVQGGGLWFAKTAGMPAIGTVAFSPVTKLIVNAGGPGEFTGAVAGPGSLGGLLSGIGGQGAPVTYAGSLTFGIDATNATGGSLTYGGNITNLNGGASALSLTTLGTGTLVLTGANTYTGGTTLNGGNLNVGSAGALGSSGTISFGGGTLQFSAANHTDYSARFSSATNQAMGFDTNGQDVSLARAIHNENGSLTKTGLGTLTFAAGGFMQTATVNGGTVLYLAVSQQLTIAATSGSSAAVNDSAVGPAFGSTLYLGYNGTGTMNDPGIDATTYIGYHAGSSGTITTTYGLSLQGEDVFPSDPFLPVIPGINLGYEAGSTGVINENGGTIAGGRFFIGNGGTGTVNQSSGVNTVGVVVLGSQSGSHGTYNMTSPVAGSDRPTLTLTADEVVGDAGTGTFNQSDGFHKIGGSLYVGGHFAIGGQGNGTYTLSNPLGYTSYNDVWLNISTDEYLGYASQNGATNTGTFIQTGGVHTIGGNLYLGYIGNFLTGATSSGSYTLSGPTDPIGRQDSALLVRINEYIGYSGTGTFTQTGGENGGSSDVASYQLNQFGYVPDIYLGYQAGATGTYNFSGGYILGAKYVGYNGSGTFNQSGGQSLGGNVVLGSGSGSSGTYNLNGGSLNANTISGGSGTSVFNFNGGTLIIQNYLTVMSRVGTVNIGAGGAIIDVENSPDLPSEIQENFTSSAPADGGLTKLGPGMLVLYGNHNYNGGTRVQAGTLILAPSSFDNYPYHSVSLTGAVTVASGATLGVGYGSIQAGLNGVVIQPGGTLKTGFPYVYYQNAFTISGAQTTPVPGACTLTLQSNSNFVMQLELFPYSTGVEGRRFSPLGVSGTVDVTGSNLVIPETVDSNSIPLAYGEQLTILYNDGTDPVIGTFAQGNLVTSSTGQQFTISYTGGDGNDIVLTAVPEPGSLVSLLGGCGLLLGCRRFRRQA
jgi:autotransporter-associated beta strand protein